MIFNIYIPRMLGSVTKKTVYDTFNNLNIGYVTDLNMFRRLNENHYPYYFAFIKLELYNTNESERLKDKLNNNGTTTITYDEEAEQYWEIKKYIPKEQRQKSTTSTNTVTNTYKQIYYHMYNTGTSQDNNIWYCDTSLLDNIISYFNPTSTSFTKDDMLDIINDYNELENEIFNSQTDLKYDV
jgi:hypothetical protein